MSNAVNNPAKATLLPLGAMLLAGSMPSMAQQKAPDEEKTLKPVVIKEKAEAPEGRDSVRATSTSIGKGKQELRDIPQSVTVVTEKLVVDRNLDTLKDVLHNTAGVTFLAAEGGEEDIRLRGFSLASTGDIFIDGMRDPAFYERDTFNNDRIELLRGSASMLFGRGSTGGVVNQVTKQPKEWTASTVATTLGSFAYRRLTGDFNVEAGDDAAIRINAMYTKADNNGMGTSIDKRGIAGAVRWGIGSSDEFQANFYSLRNNNGMNYGLPWIKPTATAPATETGLNTKLDPSDYFGMASDYNKGMAQTVGASHVHRFGDETELRTAVRTGHFERDQRASLIRYCVRSTAQPTCQTAAIGLDTFTPATVLTRANQNKIQNLDALYLQSDFSTKFNAWGVKHEVLSGVDFSNERKSVYAAVGTLNKPNTLAGTPNDGAAIDEGLRALLTNNTFTAKNLGLYVQDLVQITPTWKLLGGLRYDSMHGDYRTFATTGANVGNATNAYTQEIGDWSERVGALYQPNALHSYHVSFGTSFNTSADTYSYSALGANTPPEQSRNFEIGAKLDTADKRFTTRLAIFQSTKFNERNTDPDSAATAFLLSGKRHSSGLEVDLTGHLTPQWEVFASYVWMPDAIIDIASPTAAAGDREGERPALTPINSGTFWTTYQLTPQWRVGGGLNFRGEQTPNRNPAGVVAPAFTTVDLMAEYTFSEKALLKVNMTNLNNTLYADALYTAFYVPGAGRNVQATLTVKF